MKAYISGPYTNGDTAMNVRDNIMLGDYIAGKRVHVKIPLLTHFWHMITPHPYEFWLDYDEEELKECDIMIRMAGESKGADIEEEIAKALGMPVHHFKGFDLLSLIELDKFLDEQMKRFVPSIIPASLNQ